MIIKDMLTNVHSWKHSFFKAYLVKGYCPFYMDDNHEPYYPMNWTPFKKHRDWAFENLLLDDQNVMA